MAMVAETEGGQAKIRYGGGKNLLLIGANQRMIRCRVLVVKEQIIPRMQRIPMDTSTVCSAVLEVNEQEKTLGRPGVHIRRV